METIRNYIETMFAAFPQSHSLSCMREEMYNNMSEKYTELKAEGKSENEAIGIVIAEFGSMQELAAEMNIKLPEESDSFSTIDAAYAKRFIRTRERSWLLIAIGVCLTLLAAGLGYFGFGKIAYMVPALLWLAIAVGLFIYAGFQIQSFSHMTHKAFKLSPEATVMTMEEKERHRKPYVISIITGVILCIFSPSWMLLGRLVNGSWQETLQIGLIIFLICVAIAIFLFIYGSAVTVACNVLLQRGSYSIANKRSEKLIETIACVYWPVVIVIFLLWGFFGQSGFRSAWIVWPVAAFLFGAIAAVIPTLQGFSDKEKQKP